MKCSDPACGWEGSGKFCQECGSKMSVEPSFVVLCNGKNEDGTPCASPLKRTQKFCLNCGKKVDPGLFATLDELCRNCGFSFPPEGKFCPECGQKRTSSQADDKSGTPDAVEKAVEAGSGGAGAHPDGGDTTPEDVLAISAAAGQSPLTGKRQLAAKQESVEKSMEAGTDELGSDFDVSCGGDDGQRDDSKKEEEPSNNEDDQSAKQNHKPEPVDKSMEAGSVGQGSDQDGGGDVDSGQRDDSEKREEPSNTEDNQSEKQDHESPESVKKSLEENSDGQGSDPDGSGGGESDQRDDSENEEELSNADDDHSVQKTIPMEADDQPTSDLNVDTPAGTSNTDVASTGDAGCGADDILPEKMESIKRVSETVGTENATMQGIEDDGGSQNQLEGTGEDRSLEAKAKKKDSSIGTKSETENQQNVIDLVQSASETDNSDSEESSDSEMEDDSPVDESSTQGKRKHKNNTRHLKKKKKREKMISKNPKSKGHVVNTENKVEGEEDTAVVKDKNKTSEKGNKNKIDTNIDKYGIEESQKCVFGTGRQEMETQKTSHSYQGGLFDFDKKKNNQDSTGTGKRETLLEMVMADPTISRDFGNKTESKTDMKDVEKKQEDTREDSFKKKNESEKSGKDNTEKNQKKDEGKNPEGPITRSKTKQEAQGSSENVQRNKHTFKGKNDVEVNFHILLSPDFKFDKNLDTVVVRFGERGEAKSLGGWNSDTWKMKFVRHHQEDYVELEMSIYIPRHLLAGNSFIEYKYYVIRRSQNKQNKKRENLWDHYYRLGRAGPDVNRILRLPELWKKSDVWHQFDSVVNRKPKEGFFNWAKDLLTNTSKLIKDAKKAAEVFGGTLLKNFDSETATGDGIVNTCDTISFLVFNFLKIYVKDTSCWTTESDLKKELGNIFLEPLISKTNNYLRGKAEDNFEKRMFAIITLLTLTKKMNLSQEVLGQPLCAKICKFLLVQAVQEEKTCKEMLFIEKHFQNKWKDIKDALVNLGKYVARSKKDPSWMFLMPLIHFLSDSCKPFDEVTDDVGHDQKVPVWWGISHIGEDTIKQFKKHASRWEIPLPEVVRELSPVFEMDYLLPRTIVASLNLNEVEEVIQIGVIPPEVCCATITFFLKSTRPRLQHYNMYGSYLSWGACTTDENTVSRILSTFNQELKKYTKEHEKDSVLRKYVMVQVAKDMVKEALKTDRYLTLAAAVQSFLILSSDLGMAVAGASKHAETSKRLGDILSAISFDTRKWLDSYCNILTTHVEQSLPIWESVFSPEDLLCCEVKNNWNSYLERELKWKLHRLISTNVKTELFVTFYCQSVDHFTKNMQEILYEVALKAIDGAYGIDLGSFNTYQKMKFGALLSDMFKTEWNKMMKGTLTKDEESILVHVLEWSPVLRFLQLFYTKKDLGVMDTDCQENLMKIISIIEATLKEIFSGRISIGKLKLIKRHLERFIALADIVKSDKTNVNLKEKVDKIVSSRIVEFEAFMEQAKLMTTFTNLCQHLQTVDTSDIDYALRKQKDIDAHLLTELCDPLDVNTMLKAEKVVAKLTAFSVPDTLVAVLPDIYSVFCSNIFLKMWGIQCKTIGAGCTSVTDVVSKIWLPVKQELDSLSANLKTGELHFLELEKLIGMYQDDFDMMKNELKNLQIPEDIIKKRIHQLKQFRELKSCAYGAKVMLQFARKYNLTGDFNALKAIASQNEANFRMKEFNETLMKACQMLKDLTKKRAKCLEMFVNCEQLVNWLKESMHKSGLKELKVFVDLAFMSAGDEPLNIARVRCLHSAVTGYAPLIFELQQNSGYKELLESCRIVWKELESNPNLPEQLEATTNQLEWLKEIKKAHGSVEVTSLFQAEAINSDGIFRVGRSAQTKEKQDSILLLSNTIRLTVSEEEGKRQRRNYNYTQLQDLQSRLMLVAGKAEMGNDGVERFTEIFDSVMRLGIVHIKLCSAGCVLFKDWATTFFCDIKKPVCAILEFGKGKDVPKVKGRRSADEDLQDVIPKLANFMEDCYEEWLKYIKEKRKTYFHLNYFTVDQLVILQQELVKLGTDQEPSLLIYPLLSAVKKDCTEGDLSAAMSAAKAHISEDIEMEDLEEDKNEAENSLNEVEEADAAKAFVRELVATGYEETLACRALKYFSPDQVSEAIVWCMENEDEEQAENDDETEAMKVEETRPSSSFTGWSHSDTSIQSLISRNVAALSGDESEAGSKPLLRDLRMLWKEFLGSISSNIKDYLNLEHLGIILGFLAERESVQISRSFPPGFQEGMPNLIICPSEDVLTTALSVYMLEPNQPLPQADEILLCTDKTTKDEVDIFWRRAIFDEGKRIHCLVSADLLAFDVSEAAEQCLEEYIQESNYQDRNYRLVVICGSDNEYRSRIVASLDKHQRPLLPLNLEHLKKYVADKLKVSFLPANKLQPAGCVDIDGSSVRLIKSWRAGVGKTLYKFRREADLLNLNKRKQTAENVSIPLQEKHIDMHSVIQCLLQYTVNPDQSLARIIHLDLAHEVQYGADYLLFNLLILGCLTDKTGYVWRKSQMDLYLIETMPLVVVAGQIKDDDGKYIHQMLRILPEITCRSPEESLAVYTSGNESANDQLFDNEQFRSAEFQRPFQYLRRLDEGKELNDVKAFNAEGNEQICLQTLLRHCGIENPSWSELYHFVCFLNTQLHDFERNDFVGPAAAEDLPGFSKFVIRFLIQMSRDFSTRSLNMSEESPGLRLVEPQQMEVEGEEEEGEVLEQYRMRRTWESSPHPYLFFNADRIGFTFLGFYIDRASGDVIDQQTGEKLQREIMAQNLYDALVRNHIPIQENFDNLPRHEKIVKLCNVMGNDIPSDPDDTYELTTDNAKKIMAIYMRFRCDIPVIIMGETGCGKTRLVKFMCSLQNPPGVEIQNMILMKVHGGTTNEDIIRKVHEAEAIAKKNVEEYGQNGRTIYTVLFFDEANTTESIGLIKEIMCDKSMAGQKLKLCANLKMVAACNPYRKHSEELIKKLEQAGLGYHVDAEDTTDKLGRVPMRRLVYRVQPLPQSLLPLVWDFGQLNTQVEELYIRQMVRRYIRNDRLPSVPGFVEVVSAILTSSQEFMRQQEDECSFVSLRDVDRVLNVMSWFYDQSLKENVLFTAMDKKLNYEPESEPEEDDEDEDEEMIRTEKGENLSDITRSLVLALGVCYHACLKNRDEYREFVADMFQAPCCLPGGAEKFEEEIVACQDVFLDSVQLEKNIAKNMALKENVFMMVVCIELRIPLFLVGKPGSSKSLAKTIVSDAMQGNAARTELFKNMKQAQMVSFQCSPLSTPDGIVGTFKQCAQFQQDKDLDTFVSIVVLDEVGLAEDSPRMPLKTLHPLLEDGCQGDEKPEPYKKVAFIGISNWALDPAKMNRGILVQREVPDLEELKNSARGICYGDMLDSMEPLIEPLAKSYLKIFKEASKNMREFYGLRDFYSLVKMVYGFVEKSKKRPTWYEMLHSIKRNFGGMDNVDPVQCFKEKISRVVVVDDERLETDPDCSTSGLIQACLFNKENILGENPVSESRYLLLLTENYGALTILQQQILSHHTGIRPITIFGSSFRADQEYTQVCRNINRIKVCMETGNTVVLLNLENLYESLYDALNQYYVYFGGERYVDLGLGTHRVKCPVNQNFRLIVVAEKQTVYKKFPIPLINRLEKHFLTINTMLNKEQQTMAKELEEWAMQFSKQRRAGHERTKQPQRRIGDVFMGYHDDTCSAIILHVWKWDIGDMASKEKLLLEGKRTLLWSATPDAILTANISQTEKAQVAKIYFKEQKHENILDYLQHKLVTEKRADSLLAQVTTHSKLLATFHKTELAKKTNIRYRNIMLLETLMSFDTEQQFSHKVHNHLKSVTTDASLLIIQCDSGDKNANLIACARYCVMDELEKARDELKAPVHVVFIIQLPQIDGGCFTGFQCGLWHSVHIDTLYSTDVGMPSVMEMQEKTVASLVSEAVEPTEPMEIDEQRHILESDMDQEGSQGNAFAAPLDNHGNVSGQRGQLEIRDVLDFEEAAGDQVLEGQAHESKRSLNVKGLILSCVQSALSLVKDKEENSDRATHRVSLLLKLFHQPTSDGDISFLQGVSLLIAKLLREKEQVQGSLIEQNWLAAEASKTENLQKAGTFNRSCLQTLEAKISPILAWIISNLDTNQNLDILRDHQIQWKMNLWLRLLNTPGAVTIEFSDFKSPTRKSELKEVVVMSTGCNGHQFKAAFPFSWLIYRAVDEVLKAPDPIRDSVEDGEMDKSEKIAVKVQVLRKIFLCQTLENFVVEITADTRDDQITVLKEYIHDFVHFKYSAQNEEEHQLVCESVTFYTIRQSEELNDPVFLHYILCVHLAYDTLAPRLTYFRAMNDVWPDCSKTIISLKEEKPGHFMFSEQEFTFSALCLLLENLAADKKSLDSLSGRNKWLKKVHRYRPIVEKVIKLHAEDAERYGAHSYTSVQRARGLWSRVLVVKLFMEHVCASENEDKITIKHCMPLWNVLGAECDMKEMKSLADLERFLKTCNKTAMKQFMGQEERCGQCEVVLDGPPVVLPCEDKVCEKCYHDIRNESYTCPKCNEDIPYDWKPENLKIRRDDTEKLRNYQKRCNAFFMDVVSQLCFAENSPPADNVLQKLFDYITFKAKRGIGTKQMTVFDTGIDPNPVFRSFLLQLLIRTSEEKVTEMLEEYLMNANMLLKQVQHQDWEHDIQLGLMIVQCFEDLMRQRIIEEDEVQGAVHALKHAKDTFDLEELCVNKLYGLAEARLGLAVAAKYIVETLDLVSRNQPVPTSIRKLIEAAQILCTIGNCGWTKIYLVKYICRCYGQDIYQTLCQSEVRYLSWIIIHELNRNKVECTDRYIVLGDTYREIREAVTKVIIGEGIEHLQGTLQEFRIARGHVDIHLQLALHREITLSYLYPKEQRRIFSEQALMVLRTFVQDSVVKHKELINVLLDNKLGNHLEVTEKETFLNQGIQCLCVHFLCTMKGLDGNGTLIQPLVWLTTQPHAYKKAFLPTMPQDDLDVVREALLAARRAGGDDNPVFYRCPNGHPYVIGNCGRPAYADLCKECGQAIGGEGYILRPGNIQDQGVDQTMKGHILGRADQRGVGYGAVRNMTPAVCACLRLLTHMAMYLGALTNKDAMNGMFTPDIDTGDIPDFLWGHIHQDLQDLMRTLGQSIDDVMLIVHSVICKIMNHHRPGGVVDKEALRLSTKQGRQQWEDSFSTAYMHPILTNVDVTLQTNNNIMEDKRLGVDPLLCKLYETETQQQPSDPSMLHEVPAVWRYRTPISIDHLRREFEAKAPSNKKGQKINKVLQLFLQEEHFLRVLRCIPSILKVHRTLIEKYQRKLDKAEASTLTVNTLLTEQTFGNETEALLADFGEAWEVTRGALKQYGCPTELGGMLVQKEYCNRKITRDTPIAVLLPTTKEAGLCSYALLDFLMRKKHNDFLDKYMQAMGRKPESVSLVAPEDVTSAHLISYNTDQDIMPLVLANCQYSFEIGKGTKIEYDFTNMERQIMDRFLYSKSRIDVGRYLQIRQMVYRTEFTSAEVFKKLAEKIPQVTLNAAVKTQICNEIKNMPDLCRSLDNLDITISFLKSVGGDQHSLLSKFMEETLKMETTFFSQKAKQTCEFQHAQSLWLLLALWRSKILTDGQQPRWSIFESVVEAYFEDVPQDLRAGYKGYLKDLSVEKLTRLVDGLHEYILLKVSQRENPEDEQFIDIKDKKLGEWLYVYIDEMDEPIIDLQILTDFPPEILHVHSAHAWIMAYHVLKKKVTGRH